MCIVMVIVRTANKYICCNSYLFAIQTLTNVLGQLSGAVKDQLSCIHVHILCLHSVCLCFVEILMSVRNLLAETS